MRHGLMIISQASPNAFCFSSQKLNYEKQFDGRIWGLSGLLYTCTFMLLGAHLGTSFSEAFRVLLVKWLPLHLYSKRVDHSIHCIK